jgi:hypothetical protein
MSDANGNYVTIGTSVATPVDCKYTFTPNGGDTISILADPHDNVAECRMEVTIPDIPLVPICKALNLITSPAIIGNEIAQGQLVVLSATPIDTNDAAREPVIYTETGTGNFVADTNNAGTCPAVPASGTFEAESSCKYSYQAPSDGTAATMSVKVKQDDGVADCISEFIVKEAGEEICLALNLKVNGQYTLTPDIQAGQSYHLQVSPVDTAGNMITMAAWTENSDGKLIGSPTNPGICPASIDNGTVVTLSICEYIFASASDAVNVGFSVKAVPDDGTLACFAAAEDFQPPEDEEPFCLYLDLDYTPEPWKPWLDSEMNATVVLSDGSKYQDNVRFTTSDSEGYFSGGYTSTSGGNGSFKTNTDIGNNTTQVKFSGGSDDSGLNVFLSDTTITMSAACQRQLRPIPEEDEEEPPCTIPPTIEQNEDNDRKYCVDEYGDSESYCWEIEGPDGSPRLFTNNSSKSIGDCVILDTAYPTFELSVEDCNPKYRDYCFDNIEVDETPNIKKRIGKKPGPDNDTRYTTHVNYSSSGTSDIAADIHEVEYKLEYEPSDFNDPKQFMKVQIYDPAFNDDGTNGNGIIVGTKTKNDQSGTTSDGGYIEFIDLEDNMEIYSNLQVFKACVNSSSEIDECYRVLKSKSSIEIQGINSSNTITIKYSGILHSDITLEECQDGVWCNKRFVNKSEVIESLMCWEIKDSEGNVEKGCGTPIQYEEIISNETVAEIVCAYFLTRASGDIFLEDDLTHGIDVSKCYPFKNISSTVVKPIEEIDMIAPSTGPEKALEVISINHEICSAGQENFNNLAGLSATEKTELSKLFGSEISTLSSQICEVGLVPGTDWNKENISASINQNVGKLTRWNTGTTNKLIQNPQQIIDEGRVYYYSGVEGETVTIESLNIEEGSGALTIIIENADLQINGNIEYSSTGEAATASDISSLGVIVLNGNMYVEKDVTNLVGAYFVSRDATSPLTGNILSGSKASDPDENSDKQLTINGSIYGNIGHLLQHRVSSGDIAKDEGAITIRYDQRIIQNPPAGLAELLGEFSQNLTAS